MRFEAVIRHSPTVVQGVAYQIGKRSQRITEAHLHLLAARAVHSYVCVGILYTKIAKIL